MIRISQRLRQSRHADACRPTAQLRPIAALGRLAQAHQRHLQQTGAAVVRWTVDRSARRREQQGQCQAPSCGFMSHDGPHASRAQAAAQLPARSGRVPRGLTGPFRLTWRLAADKGSASAFGLPARWARLQHLQRLAGAPLQALPSWHLPEKAITVQPLKQPGPVTREILLERLELASPQTACEHQDLP